MNRKVMSDRGYLWESSLYALGWNELPSEQKLGVVVRQAGIGFDVFFPHLRCGDKQGWTAKVIYDEVFAPEEANDETPEVRAASAAKALDEETRGASWSRPP